MHARALWQRFGILVRYRTLTCIVDDTDDGSDTARAAVVGPPPPPTAPGGGRSVPPGERGGAEVMRRRLTSAAGGPLGSALRMSATSVGGIGVPGSQVSVSIFEPKSTCTVPPYPTIRSQLTGKIPAACMRAQ